MDGLDTLSQVALADQVNMVNMQLCFDTPAQAFNTHGRLPSESMEDSLNTPVAVTTSSDTTFFGLNDTPEPLPITATGRCMDQLFNKFSSDDIVGSDVLPLLLEYLG